MRILQHFSANQLRLSPFPFRRELSMESYLVDNPDVLTLDDVTYCDPQILDSEFHVKGGRGSQGADGRIDILLNFGAETIGIAELKLGELRSEHLVQLEDYLAEKDQILQGVPGLNDPDTISEPGWIGLLVGESICPELSLKLSRGHLSPGGIPVAGLTLRRYICPQGKDVYVVTDSYFPMKTRDMTKYEFDGKTYGKGRLVLAVVKKHVEKNPDCSFADLEGLFPPSIQGSQGVFTSEVGAREVFSNSGRTRHFLKPEEIVQLSDERIAVCNQWGIGNIDNFISAAEIHGYRIEVARS